MARERMRSILVRREGVRASGRTVVEVQGAHAEEPLRRGEGQQRAPVIRWVANGRVDNAQKSPPFKAKQLRLKQSQLVQHTDSPSPYGDFTLTLLLNELMECKKAKRTSLASS